MDNLEIYNVLKQPPKEALRQIQGGRLSGKTDINPQWRYKAMTERFGPCGIGWKYEIVRVWNEPASEGQIFAFAEVNVYIRQEHIWSDPIPGNGGSMLIEKEKAGLHASDEGYKMAITDALSTALKMIGIAADIYAGLWDGAKYRDAPQKDAGEIKGHWCKVHKTPFFKKGRMESHAHPIKDKAGKDTGKWCYEDKQPIKEQPEGEKNVLSVDMAVWLKESLDTLAWNPTADLKAKYANVKGTTIMQLVESMTTEQQTEFSKEVQERLKQKERSDLENG